MKNAILNVDITGMIMFVSFEKLFKTLNMTLVLCITVLMSIVLFRIL